MPTSKGTTASDTMLVCIKNVREGYEEATLSTLSDYVVTCHPTRLVLENNNSKISTKLTELLSLTSHRPTQSVPNVLVGGKRDRL